MMQSKRCGWNTRGTGWSKALVAMLAATMLMPMVGWAQETASPQTAEAPAAPANPMSILKAIPKDAAGMIVIRNLAELNQDIVGVARTLGFVLGPNGMFPAPLDWVKEMVGVTEGLNENDGLAFVFLNASKAESLEAMSANTVLMVPTKDHEKVIASLQGVSAEEAGLFQVSLMGEPAYAAPKGDYLLLGESAPVVTAAIRSPGGIHEGMSPDRIEAYKSNDLFAWLVTANVSENVQKELGNMLTGMMMIANPSDVEAAQQTTEQLMTFVEESSAYSLGLAIDQRGLSFHFFFRAKDGTKLAGQLKGAQVPKHPLLMGLPNEPVVLAVGATAAQSDQTESQLRNALDRLLDENQPPAGVSGEQVKSLKDMLVSLTTGVEWISVSVPNFPAEAGKGIVGFTAVMKVKDTGKWMSQAKKSFETGKQMIIAAAKSEEGVEAEAVDQAAQGVQWKAKAETIAGAQVDQIVFDLSKFPDMTEEDTQQMKVILGPEGLMLRVLQVENDYLVLGFGGGGERLANVVELIKKGEAPLSTSDSIQKIAKRLPAANRIAEGYLNIDQLVSLISTAMMQLGEPMMIPLVMRNAAPLALTAHKVDDSAQEVHVLLPMELVLSIKDAMMPLMQMFMGGGQGGGGGQMDMEMDNEPAPMPAPNSEIK